MSGRSSKSMKERALGGLGSKKRVNSKVKGNRNEVAVAKALSKWTGVEFRRTPASGAIHVPLDWLCGDVFCADKDFDFPFSVETKHYKKITPNMLDRFWEQAHQDAMRIAKYPMLIYREDGMSAGTWVVVLNDIFSFGLYNMGISHHVKPLRVVRPSLTVHSGDLFKSDYKTFLDIVNYPSLKEGASGVNAPTTVGNSS
jgi:hypothetical protein